MIRFIDIGKQRHQSNDEPDEFSFYDTVSDEFFGINGEYAWQSISDFRTDWIENNITKGSDTYDELNRFISKIPENWPTIKMK